jgi:hypothetical protein
MYHEKELDKNNISVIISEYIIFNSDFNATTKITAFRLPN